MLLGVLLPLFALAAPAVGVGLGLEQKAKLVVVHEVYAGSPAARNGAIHAGDHVVAVLTNEHDPLGWLPVKKLNVDEVVQLIKGATGDKVGLRLEGAKGQYQVYLPREEFDVP
jgi:C-terminal processing protease CtpA/Prc